MASTSKESSASATADEVAPAKNSKDEPASRKSMCRYGPGCTHIMDPSHREKFWHPRIQKLNGTFIKILPLVHSSNSIRVILFYRRAN